MSIQAHTRPQNSTMSYTGRQKLTKVLITTHNMSLWHYLLPRITTLHHMSPCATMWPNVSLRITTCLFVSMWLLVWTCVRLCWLMWSYVDLCRLVCLCGFERVWTCAYLCGFLWNCVESCILCICFDFVDLCTIERNYLDIISEILWTSADSWVVCANGGLCLLIRTCVSLCCLVWS